MPLRRVEDQNARYTIMRKTINSMSDNSFESDPRVKKARWVNIGQGPDWRDPSGATIIAHPNEIWLRDSFDHKEQPRIICVARWCKPDSTVRMGMQSWLRQQCAPFNPPKLRSETRVKLTKVKRKDLGEVKMALPATLMSLHDPARTLDEYGDLLPPNATLRDLYPEPEEDKSSESESSDSD